VSPSPSPAGSGGGEGSVKSCDQAYAEIVKLLLKKDHHPKAFADLIHLAQLKLAYRMTDPKLNLNTLESYVEKEGLHNKAKDGLKDGTSDFSKSLTGLYSKYGITEDAELISKFEKTPGYVKSRLNNETASAVLLYLSKNEKEPALPISESEVAAVWAMKRLMKDKKPGSADYNLLNFSTRLCQYFKDRSCGSGSRPALSQAQIKQDHDTLDKKLVEKLTKASEKWARDPAYHACFKEQVCDPNGQVVLGLDEIEKLKSKLAEVVARDKVDGESGAVEIDPTKTLSKGGDLTLYLKEQ
jgi:hypothetical protein